jgi:hypothetical protein
VSTVTDEPSCNRRATAAIALWMVAAPAQSPQALSARSTSSVSPTSASGSLMGRSFSLWQ